MKLGYARKKALWSPRLQGILGTGMRNKKPHPPLRTDGPPGIHYCRCRGVVMLDDTKGRTVVSSPPLKGTFLFRASSKLFHFRTPADVCVHPLR